MSAFITYIIVSIITPGPNNIFASASSAKSGFWKTMPFMLGILVGTSLIFIITGYFNLFLYENVRIITKVIGVLGGLFILYLAVRMYLDRNDQERMLISGDKHFIMAIILNFVNPKTIIFGLTVTTLYLDLGFNVRNLIWFVLFMGFLCYISVILWGLFGQLFRRLLTKHNVIYTNVMALLLGYSGVLIIIESIQ